MKSGFRRIGNRPQKNISSTKSEKNVEEMNDGTAEVVSVLLGSIYKYVITNLDIYETVNGWCSKPCGTVIV